ncbi:MAG TPA: TrmH family RNA methyltransferase [Microthrixaceae bacterium]|nr:TrmH family RNA methyltransferase [Microthrixaceae bacterium]
MRELGSTDLKRLHREWRRRTAGRLDVALDGIQGPFNVGAILRTAAAYRVGTLWLTDHSTGPDHPKVGRTSLGTERYLDVVRHPTIVDVAEAVRDKGLRMVGVELADEAVPLHELDLRGDVCLVVGNEDHGMTRDGLAACDAVGFVPQLGRIGSLNVATAASIAMYEWARQQWAP